MIPGYWKIFVEKNELVGREIAFPWPGEKDFDAIIEILSYSNIEREGTEYWLGIEVIKDGYIPVGGCGFGSGDQFFINIKDGKGGALYKIDHEQVTDGGYNREKAIEIMLSNYEQLLDWLNE